MLVDETGSVTECVRLAMARELSRKGAYQGNAEAWDLR